MLRYYADFSEAEVAAAMGISRGAVKSRPRGPWPRCALIWSNGTESGSPDSRLRRVSDGVTGRRMVATEFADQMG